MNVVLEKLIIAIITIILNIFITIIIIIIVLGEDSTRVRGAPPWPTLNVSPATDRLGASRRPPETWRRGSTLILLLDVL